MEQTAGRYGPHRMLVALSHINQVISRVRHDADQLLHEIIGTIYDELGYDVVWAAELARDGVILRAACQGQQDMDGVLDAPPPFLMTQVLATTEQGRPRLAHSADLGLDRAARASGPAAILPAPIGQNLMFALVVVKGAGQTFEAEEISLLQETASDAGFALNAIEAARRTQMAEEALRISEDRFRRLAEHATVGIVLIQNNLYRYVNPAFAQMFGYDAPRDIIDRLGPLDLTAPDSRPSVAEAIEKRVLGQIRATSLQYQGLRRDGRTFDVEEHGARTVHAQRLAVIATILDVTAREASRRRLEKLAAAGLALSAAQTPQQALDMAAEQLPSILPCDATCIVLLDHDAVHVGAISTTPGMHSVVAELVEAGAQWGEIAVIDPVIRSRDTVVLDAVQISATPHQESAARSFAGAPLVVRGEVFGCLCAEATTTERFTEEDGRHLRLFADHVAATLQHLRLVSSLETERNRLRLLNKLSHALAETLQVQEVAARALAQIGGILKSEIGLLFLWDTPTKTLTLAGAEGIDAASAALLAKSLADAGPTLIDRIEEWHLSGGTGPAPYRAILDIAGHRDEAKVVDVPLEAHGEFVGALSFTSRSGARGFDPDDTALAAALVAPVALALQNARFYERAESQAQAMASALRRQEELDRMKDELIQNVSHELRTPLALVMGYAELLASGRLGELVDVQAEAMDIIVRRSRMLRSLVEDISLLWHLERRIEDFEPVDLQETVTMAVAEFQAQASSKGLSITADTPATPVTVLGVPLQLRRVLDNLIGNTLKFTPAGGSINVTLTSDGQAATIGVTDSGIGVPEEHLERIFERFYQVDGSSKRKYGGTGLGLALVRAIVERHRGTIWAESPVSDCQERPGTRVIFHLPLLEAPGVPHHHRTVYLG